MRLYLSKKMGPFRLGGGIKLTWWNAFFIAMAALCYYMVYLCVLLIELMLLVYFYMFKWMFLGLRWCFRKIKALIINLFTSIKRKPAGH